MLYRDSPSTRDSRLSRTHSSRQLRSSSEDLCGYLYSMGVPSRSLVVLLLVSSVELLSPWKSPTGSTSSGAIVAARAAAVAAPPNVAMLEPRWLQVDRRAVLPASTASSGSAAASGSTASPASSSTSGSALAAGNSTATGNHSVNGTAATTGARTGNSTSPSTTSTSSTSEAPKPVATFQSQVS